MLILFYSKKSLGKCSQRMLGASTLHLRRAFQEARSIFPPKGSDVGLPGGAVEQGGGEEVGQVQHRREGGGLQ